MPVKVDKSGGRTAPATSVSLEVPQQTFSGISLAVTVGHVATSSCKEAGKGGSGLWAPGEEVTGCWKGLLG